MGLNIAMGGGRKAMKNSYFTWKKPSKTLLDPIFWVILAFQCTVFSLKTLKKYSAQ